MARNRAVEDVGAGLEVQRERPCVPPWKVGVAANTLVPWAIVMLCIKGEVFVKSIVTLPAVADRFLVV